MQYVPSLVLALIAVSSLGHAQTSFSPMTAAGAQAKAGVPQVFAPTIPRMTYTRYPWKTQICATVFWIGEDPSEGNPTPNHKSAWDVNWKQNYGGMDTPDATKRTANFTPGGFVPRLNPFYIALPYNDVTNSQTRAEAAIKVPWFKQRYKGQGKSVLKDQWLAIRYGMRVCYAQWEDVGPFEIDDVDYVFGPNRPKNEKNQGAGIDVAPAVRDYLGLKPMGKVDWRFVDLNEIPDGPWRWFGTNNPFTTQKSDQQALLRSRLEELRKMRDQYFKQNGNAELRNR